ncbi:MAG: nucleotidyltransferase family protein [Clostridiales bacterium]|jgi:molybdenum cofactor cytidylyltransferase|nr:nucleotidyltransferase family protein [Clostridiales bacterium]
MVVAVDTDVVILAGGYSSRANAFKMELLIDQRPILQHVIDAFLPICSHIIVVGGYQMERIYPLIDEYKNKVSLVYNENYSKGMFSSVKRGIVEVKSSQFFLTPGDVPFITTHVARQLLEYSGQIVKPRYQGHGGHPILIPYRCIEEILAESEDSNLKIYLDKQDVKSIEVEDESILFDIDTPKDYEDAKLIQRIRKVRSDDGWM